MSLPSSHFFKGRRCLVTGGSGFIGSHFVEALLQLGAFVRVALHQRPKVVVDSRIDYVTTDLERLEDSIRAVQGMDIVIHAAGSVGAAGTDPADILSGIAVNIQMTATVIRAAWQANVGRCLVFSSSTGYPVKNRPIREDEFYAGPVHPSYEGYGQMRRFIEQLADFAAKRSTMHMCIIRPGAVYGPRDSFDPHSSHVISSLIRRAELRENPFIVWGSGQEVRDFLHVTDFVRGCLLAMEHGQNCDPVNIASGQGVTVGALVEQVLAVCGFSPATVQFDTTKPVTIPVRLIDISKARTEFGFAPEISLTDGLRGTVEWYRDQAV